MIARLILVVLVACASMVGQASTCPIPGPELPACNDHAGCVTDIRQGGGNVPKAAKVHGTFGWHEGAE